ncbi:MAG: transcriptional repressor [Bacteroidaceae bacterium]|nr:transcriptional repressor [Bacteroidaceae bacterium]
MSEQNNLQEIVAERLQAYLKARKLRHTPERFAILEAIYETEGTFTAEQLREIMEKKRFPVSIATVYATTRLLVEANLLMRHPYNSASALFERIIDPYPRVYLVCGKCGNISQLKNKELLNVFEQTRTPRFTTTHRIAYIYGFCSKCQRSLRYKKRPSIKQKNQKHT